MKPLSTPNKQSFDIILVIYPAREGVSFLARPSKLIPKCAFKSQFDTNQNQNEKQLMENIRQSPNNSSNPFLKCMLKLGAKEHYFGGGKHPRMGTHKIQMTMTQELTEFCFYCERILIALHRLAFGSLFNLQAIPPYFLGCLH